MLPGKLCLIVALIAASIECLIAHDLNCVFPPRRTNALRHFVKDSAILDHSMRQLFRRNLQCSFNIQIPHLTSSNPSYQDLTDFMVSTTSSVLEGILSQPSTCALPPSRVQAALLRKANHLKYLKHALVKCDAQKATNEVKLVVCGRVATKFIKRFAKVLTKPTNQRRHYFQLLKLHLIKTPMMFCKLRW